VKRLTPKQAYSAVRRHLTPDLLKPKYRKLVQDGADKRTGHCYAASEAFYHLVGGKAEGYKPMFLSHEGEPHWWIQGPDAKVWDLTSEQFDTPVPYGQGRGKGFLTKDPSRRAADLIQRATKGKRAMTLRTKLIRLAHARPELRDEILPLLKEAAGESMLYPETGRPWNLPLPGNSVSYTLAELQGWVGGYIEMIRLPGNMIMLVNEEGLMKRLKPNRPASQLARRPIVGPAVVIPSNLMK